MNVRISYETKFPAAFYLPSVDDSPTVMVNDYNLRLDMVTMSEDHATINVAMERLKIFVADVMTHTLFVNRAHQDQIQAFMNLGISVTTLPEDPVDQIIGLMLYSKLNAIMCGRIRIHSLDISSRMGDSVWFGHMDHESQGPFEQDGWWNLSSTLCNDFLVFDSPKVSRLVQDAWKQYDLDWPDDQKNSKEAKILYADFRDREPK